MFVIPIFGCMLMAASVGAWPALAFPLPAGSKAMTNMPDPVATVAQAINEHPPQLGQGGTRPPEAQATGPQSGQLAVADIEKAILLIANLRDVFGRLAEGADDAPDKASWGGLHKTYDGSAKTLRNLLTAGRVKIQDLTAGIEGAVAGDALLIDSTLDGRWNPEAVGTKTKVGEEDWAEISTLAGVLIQQLALRDPSARWDEWLEIHAQDPSFRSLPIGEREAALRPHLVRIWHIGDKYLANQISGATAESGPAKEGWKDRDIALHNEMLAALWRLEQEIGWDWRDRLETAWNQYQARVRNLVTARNGLPAKLPEPQPAEAAAGSAPAVRRIAEAPEAEAVDLAELRPEIEALHQAMREREREIGVFKDLLESTRAKEDELGLLLEAQTARLEALSETLPLARGILTNLDRVSAEQASIEAQLAELRARMPQDPLQEELAQFRDWIERQQGRATRLEESLGALSSRLDSTEGQVAGVREDLASFSENMAELGERLHEETTALGAQVAELLAKTEPEALEAAIAQLRGMTQMLEVRSTQFGERFAGISTKLESIGQEVAKSRVESTSLRDKVAELAQRLAVIQAGPRGEALRQDIKEIRSTVETRSARLEEALVDLSTELSATGQRVTELRVELTSQRETTQELRGQLPAEAAQRQIIYLAAFGAALLLALAIVAAVLLRMRRELDRRLGAAGQVEHGAGLGAVSVTEKGVAETGKQVPEAEAPGPAPETEAASLRRELDQLRVEIERYSEQDSELAQRITGVGAGLGHIQNQMTRLQEDLHSIRAGATTIGDTPLDQMVSRDALREELDRLREEFGLMHERAETAEGRPAERQTQALEAELAPLGDRKNSTEGAEEIAVQPSPTPAVPKPEHWAEATARIRERAVAALKSEDLQSFEESLAQLTELPLQQLRDIVLSPGGKNLATACLATEIKKAHFIAAFLLSRRDKARQREADPLELSSAMSFYEQTSEYEAKEILAKWRSDTRCEEGLDHNPARKEIAGERPVSEKQDGTQGSC